MARSKEYIVRVILEAEDDAPVVLAAESRFGSHAFDTHFADIPERALQEWYSEYLADQEPDLDWADGYSTYMSGEGDR